MLSKYRNQLLVHFIVFIWGFTAILGKLIEIPATGIVWYRVFIAAAGLFIFILLKKQKQKFSWLLKLKLLVIGVCIALHWIFFFEAIKVSNVSITLACLSSGALFASLLEPVFFKRKIIPYEIIFGLIVMLGLYMIFKIETQYALGMMYSVIAAFLAAMFTMFNGQLIQRYEAKNISMYEMLGGFIGISIYFLATEQLNIALLTISWSDLFYLLILGLICTAFAFSASVGVMKEVSPYTMVLSVNMEPVYGIILAYFIFGDDEKMTPGFYLGAFVIIATVFANAMLKSRKA